MTRSRREPRVVGRNLWLAGIVVLLLAGLFITPYDPYGQDFFDLRGKGASLAHWLGVDRLGQDFFSRIWRGAGNSILFATIASVASLGLSGGLLWVERRLGATGGQAIRALVAFGIALPAIFIGLLIVTFSERSATALTIAVSLAGVPFGFRQMRALWLEQRKAAYVEASRAIGGSQWHLFAFALWPNLRPQLVELWKLMFALSLLELSALTYLGLAGDPNWAELGTLLRDGQKMLLTQPGFVIWPGLVLTGVLGMARLVRAE